MNFIKDIQDKTIIICENNYKNYILKKLSEYKLFLDVKIMSKKEFLENYLFKYDEKTISYLVNKYNYKVDIAKMYLNNLYYIDGFKDYKNDKLNYLVNLKNELKDNNLIKYNDKFKKYILSFKLLVVGYPYLENYELEIFKLLNATFIKDIDNYTNINIYEFKTIEEEINYVCKSICKLISDGVDINKIKLVGVSSDYYNDLERIFSLYNIPLKIDNEESIYSNIITSKFLNNYSGDMIQNIEVIKNDNKEIVNKIINICNKYTFIEDKMEAKPLIINDLKNTYINNFKLKNYIEIVDLFYPFTSEYVFLMNFNEGVFPKTFKDEDYITDNIKEYVNMNLTNYKNKIYKEATKNKIKSINNLTITYKLRSNDGEFYPSSLISELDTKVLEYKEDIRVSYSYLYDKIEFAKMEDNYNKYGSINDNYYVYKNSLGNIFYNSYDNKYKGIDVISLKNYLKNKLTLSYSSLNNFNKCSFRYYIANILKLDKYEESFETFIGSLFHTCLEKCFKNNLDVEEEVNNYILSSGKSLSVKEKFFVNMLVQDIKFAIDVLNKQKEDISLDKVLYEKNISIDKSRDILVEFIGFVDKILYKENNDNTLVSIIDYKTGNIDIELKYLPYGLSLQLPVYLYLVKKSNLFVNPRFVGFYLQYILDKDISRDIKKNYEEERYNNLKLMGYSNSNIHSLVEFDKNYENSNLIRGMRTKANGDFYSNSKVLCDEEIEKIISLTEKNIDEAIDKILNAEFNINPKKIGYDKDLGCMYCKFKDICFKKENDYLILDEINNLDFLKES